MYSGSNWGSGGEGLLPDVYAGNFEIIVFTPYVETGSLEITVTAPNWYSTQHIDVEVTIEGTTGDCVWTITGTADNYTLTIDGTGAMADYYSYDRPWEEYRNNIKTVVIQDGVRSIGEFAFGDCYGLTGSLTIPNSVTYIGNNAFRDCSGLTGSLTIGNSVTSIGDRAFLNCSGLTGSLTIGSSVTSISNYAFYGCSGFTGVTNLNPVPQSISSDDVFYGVPVSSLTLKVPSGSVAAYQAADVWRNFGSIQAIE
jgi:hypothetical protein